MFSNIFSLIRKWAASAERDRLEEKIDRLNGKLDHFDERLDRVEMLQAQKSEQLRAIHEITLANHEALEQKFNASKVTTDAIRQIVDVRIESFQDSIKSLQASIEKILRRDCNLS
ncbi:MAG: hypothetical protein IM516_01245 [Pseudanabaena sp. M158S2SP1A06QC]|nr:hypothetical protein [Pseudanabaena sp. M151S2SP2A07QC]MCA6610739.1 hypothetical protein [Pseudanabaena sp. M158S2SP1A06QC]MCA6623306.1 hypothetical protein [Pseudanabaena sp. M165S2SP1A06QC]